MNNAPYPCLWFTQGAKEAAEFYCKIFPNSKIVSNNAMATFFTLYFLFLNGQIDAYSRLNNEVPKKLISKLNTANNNTVAMKVWEATPDGIRFKKWEASPAGKKVYASEAKVKKSIKAFSNMEGVVTSLSLPQGARLGYGVMVKINGEDFILAFGICTKNEVKQLQALEVNDKIVIKSRGVSHAPKYAFPILSGDYIERDQKILYKRPPNKGGC